MNLMAVLFAFVLGACLGSFAAATVYVWCHGRPFWRRRSCCPRCGHVLKSRELVPILSYCLLRGRCAHCGGSISFVYTAVELACACAAALFAWKEGLSAVAFMHILLAATLVSASLCDIRTGLLPDALTLGGLTVFPPLLVLLGDIPAKDALLGVLAGCAVPLFLRQIFLSIRHKDVLGLGDIKLLALLGGVCGWYAIPYLLFYASVAGIAVFVCAALTRRSTHGSSVWMASIPFGPFLCGAALVILLFPETVTIARFVH